MINIIRRKGFPQIRFFLTRGVTVNFFLQV
jgi:hypothetical protein